MKAKALSYLDDLFYEGPVPNLELIPDDVPEEDLLDSDGIPMDTSWQVLGIQLLMDVTAYHFRHRNDFFIGGNHFVYYRPKGALRHMFRGPDFFLVWNTTREPIRRYWMVWNEGGRVPNVVFELSSKRSLPRDLGEKKDIYERDLRVPEYFLLSENAKTFRGFRLGKRRYKELKTDNHGWFWSEQLQLFVGPWRGEFGGYVQTWLRFYDVEGNLVLTEREANAQRAEQEKQRAEQEKQRAEQEKQRAEQEKQRAEQEKAARIAAEAELGQLRERLAKLEGRRNGNGRRGNGSNASK